MIGRMREKKQMIQVYTFLLLNSHNFKNKIFIDITEPESNSDDEGGTAAKGFANEDFDGDDEGSIVFKKDSAVQADDDIN